jgi:hypothetical protein
MATDRKVNGAGFQLIIASGSVSAKVRQAILDGLVEVGKQYKAQVLKNISLDDHTLAELRKLGHPYSTAFKGDGLHGDDALVHVQTGRLKKSIRLSPPEETTTRRFSVYVTSNVPYMPFLLYGTSTMRARPFHQKSFDEIKDKFWKPVLDKVSKVEHRIATDIRMSDAR